MAINCYFAKHPLLRQEKSRNFENRKGSTNLKDTDVLVEVVEGVGEGRGRVGDADGGDHGSGPAAGVAHSQF